MVEREFSKLDTRVRFPSPAPNKYAPFFRLEPKLRSSYSVDSAVRQIIPEELVIAFENVAQEKIYAPLAQWIERHASDVEVGGSNPLGRAR